MIRQLFEWLWPPRCDHEWELVDEWEQYWHALSKHPHGHKVVFMCSKCKRVKKAQW